MVIKTGRRQTMTLRQLWIHSVREEQSLRENAAAWRLALEQAEGEAERAAVRSLLRALEFAQDRAARTQRSLWLLSRREEV